jgi:hypothetical protein
MNEANYGKCRDLSVIWEFSKNYCSSSVLLVRITVAVGISEKDTLQRLAEC